MLDRFGKNEPSIFDAEITRIVAHMAECDPEEQEYKRMIKHLERLEALKTGQRREKLNPNTMLSVGGTVLAVLIMVSYEHNHAILTKALMLIKPPKI
jgi:hypothetical protein